MLERRSGRDNWTSIIDQEGSAWVADYEMGKLTLYELPGAGHLPALLRNWRERFIRTSYRLGIGGEYARAGQTTLSNSLSQGTTGTVSVADATRLPPEGGTMLVGSTEYVAVGSVDHGADELTIDTRGVRATQDTDHDAGAIVHFCPLDVRDAIAGKAAAELQGYDIFVDQLIDTGEAVNPRDRIETWETEWNRAVASYSDNYGYK